MKQAKNHFLRSSGLLLSYSALKTDWMNEGYRSSNSKGQCIKKAFMPASVATLVLLYVGKVRIFWEVHKIWKNLPLFDITE